MDKLDQEIAEKSAEAQSLRDRLHALEIEISVLKRAASLRPIPTAPSEMPSTAEVPSTADSAGVMQAIIEDDHRTHGQIISPSTGRPWHPGKGRQPGAISAKWRDVLLQMHRAGQATVDEISVMAGTTPNTVRSRMLLYMSLNYVESVGIDTYRVTEGARKRFGMVKGLIF